MQLVDGMVQRTNEQLTESTSLLQDILKAAADPQVPGGASQPAEGGGLQRRGHEEQRSDL